MRLSHREDGWWITDVPDLDDKTDDCGPYETRKLAEEGRQRLKRFYRELRKDRIPGADKAIQAALQ